jgi:demethylmenaquinone methyltransferase / 2-methoxy-6-polyprenyl-1,4-benzoquinol methylase
MAGMAEEVPREERRRGAEGGAGAPAAARADWAAYVAGVFARVAPRYDLVNNLMTGWQHGRWRRRTLDGLGPLTPKAAALDLCCGTGDFLLLLAERVGPEGRLVGVDFCAPMLELAQARLRAAGAASRVQLLPGDVTRLTDLAAESFDVITVGFGLRNVADLDAALGEAFRLLRPGGTLASLDLSWPARGLVGTLGLAYVRSIVPWLARLAGARPEDFRWLRQSLEHFPDAAALAERLRAAGFTRVGILRFGLGLVAAHVALKA